MRLPPNTMRLLRKSVMQPSYALKVAAKRLQAYMYYRFGGGRAGAPESLTLFLTHRCNLRCRMCGQWGEGGVTKSSGAELVREDLPVSLLKSAVDGLSGSAPAITLFGGEPLLYKGCTDLIRHIKSKRMHCLMITNGSMIREYAAELVGSGIDELNVSIDGKAEVHDKIRGMPGLYDRIMSGLKEVNRIKLSGKRKKPIINIQCTINSENYLHLEDMPEVVLAAGADSVTFHNLIFTSKEVLSRQSEYDSLLDTSSDQWKGFDFEPGIDPEILIAKMARILAGKYPFRADMYPDFSPAELKRYYTDPMFRPIEYKTRCLSPWIAAYVFPDGTLRPCLNSAYSFGNIKEASVTELWNGEKAVRYRGLLKKSGIFPACARCTELYRY